MDGMAPPNHERIRRDLARTVIKEPLYRMIQDALESPDRKLVLLPVIIEANDGYYLGKDEVFKQVLQLAAKVVSATADPPVSQETRTIGGKQNPYFKSRLRPADILSLVETDYADAKESHAAAWKASGGPEAGVPGPPAEGGSATSPEAPTKTAKPPSDMVRYLKIRRIWY